MATDANGNPISEQQHLVEKVRQMELNTAAGTSSGNNSIIHSDEQLPANQQKDVDERSVQTECIPRTVSRNERRRQFRDNILCNDSYREGNNQNTSGRYLPRNHARMQEHYGSYYEDGYHTNYNNFNNTYGSRYFPRNNVSRMREEYGSYNGGFSNGNNRYDESYHYPNNNIRSNNNQRRSGREESGRPYRRRHNKNKSIVVIKM